MKDHNEELIDAVSRYDTEAVKYCLENGADPNYTFQAFQATSAQSMQPTTALQLVMFRISDALLKKRDLAQLLEITKVLLAHGADPKPAMQIAEHRYGKYNPEAKDHSFMEIWHLIAKAQK